MTLLLTELDDVQPRERLAFRRLPQLAFIAFVVFCAVTIAAAWNWTSVVDRGLRITTWLSNDVLDEVLKEVERPGQRVVVLPILFVLTALQSWRIRKAMPILAAVLSVAIVNIAVGIVKWWSHRATPRLGGPEFFNDQASRVFGAYPSGHATNVGMWATLAWFLVFDAPAKLRRTVRAGAVGMVTVIMLCSWARTTHWVTDLLAGLALGVAIAAASLWLSACWSGPRWSGTRWSGTRR